MADDQQGPEPSVLFEARFRSATRLDDPNDDEVYEVTFELLGPAANGTVHVSLAETDEALLIGEASICLEEALRGWLRMVEQRNGTGSEPKG